MRINLGYRQLPITNILSQSLSRTKFHPRKCKPNATVRWIIWSMWWWLLVIGSILTQSSSLLLPLCLQSSPFSAALSEVQYRHNPSQRHVAYVFVFFHSLAYRSFCLQWFHEEGHHVSKQAKNASFAKQSSIFVCLHLVSLNTSLSVIVMMLVSATNSNIH